jgi:hypothetical protein
VDYVQFKQQFDATHDALILPTDCQEPQDPLFSAVTEFSWMLEWYLMFSGDKFLRIWEDHQKWAGLQESRRVRLAYHYGPVTALDAAGLPKTGSAYPVDIRIDNSQQRIHMHYGASNPHYPQEKVQGLELEKLEMFAFVRAIFKHRKSGQALDKVLGFRIL